MLELAQQYLIFVVLTFLLCSTANTLIWRYFSDEVHDVFDWLILFFIFVASGMLLVMGGAGFLGHLNLTGQVVGTLVVFLVGGVRLSFLGGAFQIGSLMGWKKLRQLLFRQEVTHGPEWVFALFGFLLLFGAVEFFNAFVQYPWEYDTIAYHMPIVVEWIQAGNLWEVFYAVWGGPLGYYPSHHELLLTWFVIPFGNDYLVNTLNFSLIITMVVVVYKILKRVQVGDLLAWMGGALVMVMPIFLRQIGTSQVDVLTALGVLIAWYYLLRTFQRKDGLLLIPFMLNIALLLGSKYLAIVYAIPVLVVCCFLMPFWRKFSRLWWLWSLLILGTLGSMWYWRNLMLTGNPIFPAELQIGDWVVFEGYPGLMERIQGLSLWDRVIHSGEWGEWLAAMTQETGWHLYLVVIAYGLLTLEMLYKLVFSGLQRGEGKIYVLMLFFLPAYWYLYFISPYSASMMMHNVRYAMPWLLLAMIMVVYVVHKLGPARKFFVMALMGVLWWQFLLLFSDIRSGNQTFLDVSYVYAHPLLFVLLLVVLGLVIVFIETWRKQHWWRSLVGLLFVLVSFVFLQQVIDVRSDIREEAWAYKYAFPIMQAYEWIDAHVPPDATVANSLNPLYYPLYGKDLQRKVRYVNINGCSDCDYYDYKEKNISVRDRADYGAWRENLRQFDADYVLLAYSIKTGLEDVRPYELEWVQEYSEDFELVFEAQDAFVYRVKKGDL